MRLYDTRKREKVPFEPLKPDHVGIYVCGPTVYDHCHIGHARAYVAFDVVVRHLRHSGATVTYVRNITDIDDKIINRARELGEEPITLAKRFTDAFHHDMALLGNLEPDIEPTVSGHLPEIIRMVEQLVADGHAYVVDGDVYFSVDSYPAYGALSARQLDELQAGARVEIDERKRNPLDFALWKSVKPGEPSWDSPWGKGRPGWHIECSAMSGRYLGETFDIHGGGMDLIFPHHENEVAQSCAAHGGETFARYWLHNGFVNVRTPRAEDDDLGEEKMSKSLGNFFTIREVCAQHEPEALRLLLLGTHYRGPVSFEIARLPDVGVTFPGVEEAERRLAYSYRTLERLQGALSTGKAVADEGTVVSPADTFATRLHEALDDDFNAAAALGLLAEVLTLANRLIDQPKAHPKDVQRRTLQRIAASLAEVRATLGLLAQDPSAFLERRRTKLCAQRGIDAAHVEQQIEARREARRTKDFARADTLRAALTASGVELMDRPDGSTTWAVREE